VSTDFYSVASSKYVLKSRDVTHFDRCYLAVTMLQAQKFNSQVTWRSCYNFTTV